MQRHGDRPVRMVPGRIPREVVRRLTTLAAILLATALMSTPSSTSSVTDRVLSLIGATAPGPPVGVTAKAGDKQVTASWAAPENDGGAPITSYTVSVHPGSQSTTTDGNTFSATVTGLENGTPLTVSVTAENAVGKGLPAVANVITSPPGYWFVASDGGVFSFGGAPFLGSMGSIPLNEPVVGMAANSSVALGYWMVAADGGIFSFGDAPFFGSMGAKPLNQPIVGMAATFFGDGYWLVASDGGIFNFGNAGFFDSAGNIKLNNPIVGIAPTVTGLGYWLVASDGGIFAFGDAVFHGSTGDMRLNEPIVGMAPTITGGGYWLVAEDGGMFSFGDAVFHGSTGGSALNLPVVGMASTPTGQGYWLVASDGGIFSFGDAQFLGSTGARELNRPVVGMATVGAGRGTTVIPLGLPGPPRNVEATGGDGTITVTWAAPIEDGGCPITEYTVTASDGTTQTVSGTTFSAVFTGLELGQDYSFTVRASNCLGDGAFSSANEGDTVVFVECPGPPTGVVAADGGDHRAKVEWNAPISDGGSSIISYTVTAYQGGVFFSRITVEIGEPDEFLRWDGVTLVMIYRPLEIEIPYTFTVLATNSTCDGEESIESNEVIPVDQGYTEPSGPSGPSEP